MIRRLVAILLSAGIALAPAFADDRMANRRTGPGSKGGGLGDDGFSDRTELYDGRSLIQARIKDIAQIQSSRDNQLVGYGLVIGLNGSGDGLRNSPFTEQSLNAMLENLGIAAEGERTRSTNVAAVIVTANLPPFVKAGTRIDVSVSSLGDATSLQGGTLVMTPLKAANGDIYAVAQGPVFISGFTAQGDAETVTQGVPTAGRVPNGAVVEREVQGGFAATTNLTLQLRNADYSTAVRVADTINDYALERFGRRVAAEQDSRTVTIAKPANISAPRFMAELENLVVETDAPARVVIDERTGTIVIGNEVKISRVAVSHGTLTVRITEAPQVVQPEPFSRGETAVEPYTAIDVSQPDGKVAVLDGPNLDTLVSGLNRLGVKPDGIIAILQGIKSAGALQADLVLQ